MENELIKEECPYCGVEVSNPLQDFSNGEEPHTCPHCQQIYYCVEHQFYRQITLLALSKVPGSHHTSSIYIDTQLPEVE